MIHILNNNSLHTVLPWVKSPWWLKLHDVFLSLLLRPLNHKFYKFSMICISNNNMLLFYTDHECWSLDLAFQFGHKWDIMELQLLISYKIPDHWVTHSTSTATNQCFVYDYKRLCPCCHSVPMTCICSCFNTDDITY